MQSWVSRRTYLFVAVILLMLLVPLASAQSDIPENVTIGATVGAAADGNTWSGGGTGPWTTVHVDVPVRSARVRFSGGVTSWTPNNDPQDGGLAAGRVWLTHLAVTAVRTVIEPTVRYPLGAYYGLGVSGYRYDVQHGRLAHRHTGGLHGVGGLEYVLHDRRLVVRAETEIHFAGGPGHPQIWAYTLPMISGAIGISRRF
jgi:hypothetical protein